MSAPVVWGVLVLQDERHFPSERWQFRALGELLQCPPLRRRGLYVVRKRILSITQSLKRLCDRQHVVP